MAEKKSSWEGRRGEEEDYGAENRKFCSQRREGGPGDYRNDHPPAPGWAAPS